MMLPLEFKERMREMLGSESERLFDALENENAVKSFRVNKMKTTVATFEAFEPEIDRQAAIFPPDSYITTEEQPGFLPCHHSGAIYMQDPSAMATVHALDIPCGIRALDSCSAPGGKTTQIAEAIGENGILVANEYDTKRCRILQGNIERLGAKNTVVMNHDTRVLAQVYPKYFDLVLVDAPCSGEGMFRKNPQAIEEWSLENVKMCAERQREILDNLVLCVAPGGHLVYSTCTFSLEENEMNVDWFLEKYPQFTLEDVKTELRGVTSDGICFTGCKNDMKKTRRFYPHKSQGEGQFIALFLNREEGKAPEICEKKTKKSSKSQNNQLKNKQDVENRRVIESFLDEILTERPDKQIVELGGKYYLSPSPHLPEYGVFTSGVCIGEVQRGRVIPHHQLFSAYGDKFKLKVNLKSDMKQALDYLRGYEFNCEDYISAEGGNTSGYAALMIDGCATGGVKISGGIAKNHYPKGLRNKQ